MSSPPYETIIIDGIERMLGNTSPLEQLWLNKTRPVFKFQLQYSEHKIDYIASWSVEDNSLWLVDFECQSYKIKKLFVDGVKKKIKALWYSGDIVFGIGVPEQGFLGPYYRSFATYEVVKGEVVADSYKGIRYEPVKYEDTFNFGKHKGRKIENVIVGIKTYEEESIVNEYLKEVISVFQYGGSNIHRKIYLPTPINENVKSLFSYPDRLNLSVSIDKYIFLKGSDEDAKKIEEFGDYLIQCFGHPFYVSDGDIKYYQEFGNSDDVISSSLAIKTDAQYISWVVNNVDKFQIQPHIICGKHICRELRGFHTQRIAYDIILLKPIIEELEYSFPIDIINICVDRCLKKHNLQYDIQKGWYVKTKIQPEDKQGGIRANSYSVDKIDYNELYFDAMTDGQSGDYEDFEGDIDDLDS